MDKFIKNTIEKIKQQHIVPEARWRFLARKYGIWALFAMIIFAGAASFATAYHLLASLDWDLYRFMHISAFSYTLSIIPYIWLIFILLALVVAFIDVRKTQTGYRFSALKISALIIVGIILFGMGMSVLGIGGSINDIAAKKVPYYGKHMMTNKNSQWSQPEKGLIAGTINSVSQSDVSLTDLEGGKWTVEIGKDVLIRPAVNIEPQEMVKVIGKKKDSSTFEAREIRPWMGRGMMNGYGREMKLKPMEID
jgi:hypothetical protein